MASRSLQPSPAAIPALTGIRPFASLLVFAFHFCRPVVTGGPAWLRSLVGAGYVAVSFFFVLSGFLLAVSHRGRLVDGTLDRRRFFARRLGRIYPAYLLGLALMLPLALCPAWRARSGAFPSLDAAGTVGTGLLHLSALQAWWPPLTLTWNLPGWSVSVELACYLAFVLFAGSLARWPRRALAGLGAGLWAASLLLTVGYTLFAGEARAAHADASTLGINVLKLWPPMRLPEFFFGVAVGLLFATRDPRARAPRGLGLALGLGSTAVILLVLTHAEAVPYAVLHNALLLPAFGALLWAVASAEGPVAALLGSRAFVALGKSTYALYILQMPLMYWLLLAGHAARVSLAGARFLALFVPLVLGVTVAARLTVERYGRRWLTRRLEASLAARPLRTGAAEASAKQAA